MGRRKVHDEALRVRLLDRAGELLSGGEPLGLRQLAEAAGTSTTAVYSLFGGKTGLLRALQEEGFARLSLRLREVPAESDPVEHLVQLARAYRCSALADPHYYRAMFEQPRLTETDEQLRRAGMRAFDPLLDAVRTGIERGLLADAEPTRVASALWAQVHGLVSLELGDLLPEQDERTFELAIRTNLVGWRPTAAVVDS